MFSLKQPIGRTGNILLQNVGISVLSKYYDLMPTGYISTDYFNGIGFIPNQNGRIIYPLKEVDDYSLPLLLENERIDYGIIYNGGFQVNEFVRKFRTEIVDTFTANYTNSNNNDVFVHVRLGDAAGGNPGIDFYRNALSNTSFEKGYISSDSPTHHIVSTLIKEFRLIPFLENDPLSVINFAKDFKHLIISKGTFSWWMAMLSKSNNIIVPIGDSPWYGDIFIFEDWNYIKI